MLSMVGLYIYTCGASFFLKCLARASTCSTPLRGSLNRPFNVFSFFVSARAYRSAKVYRIINLSKFFTFYSIFFNSLRRIAVFLRSNIVRIYCCLTY